MIRVEIVFFGERLEVGEVAGARVLSRVLIRLTKAPTARTEASRVRPAKAAGVSGIAAAKETAPGVGRAESTRRIVVGVGRASEETASGAGAKSTARSVVIRGRAEASTASKATACVAG